MRLVEYSDIADCFIVHLTREELDKLQKALLYGTFDNELYYKIKQILGDNKCVNNSSD